jgi:signal transduction histidine kinase
MLTSLLSVLQTGWVRMRRHSELWFVIILAVVLPTLVVLSAQTTLTTATSSMVGVEKARIATLHSAAAELLLQVDRRTTQQTREFLSSQSDIITTRLLADRQNDGVTDTIDVFATSSEPSPDRAEFIGLAKGRPGETFIFEFIIGGKRTWYAYRSLIVGDQTAVLETVHDLSLLDSRLERRLYETYALVAFVVMVIMGLAYWMARQVDYRARFAESTHQLREHERFTSTIVHELRAPLTAMRGYASMIEEDTALPAPTRAQGEQIKRSAARLVALVSDYLEVTRLRSGAATLERTPLDIVAVVRAVVSELEPMAHEKHLTISVVAPDTPLMVPSNQKLLTQALTNLVSNAIKYTPQGHVEVVVADEAYAVEVRIKDTGMGMSAEDQKRLFAPFSRVGDDTAKAVTGSGLGMWITKLLVEQLGGTIGVESIKGVGTHVVMRFKKR